MKIGALVAVCAVFSCAAFQASQAEILAMMNYESKPADQLKSLKLTGNMPRREGIAIVDVDPASPDFGRVLSDIPIDPKTVAHHIFYDRSMKKAYLTALGGPPLQVMDLTQNPYRMRVVETPECKMAEDVVFDQANERWYLSCLASGKVVVGKVATDEVVGEIDLPGTYPHGVAVDTSIDRVLVTSTVSPDLQTPDEVVSIVRASTLEPLGKVTVAEEGSPSGPVELLMAPNAETPTVMVTNMLSNDLWALVWDGANESFKPQKVFDFESVDAKMPLEMYFNKAGDRMYVTTATPGQLHIFDVSDGVLEPKLVTSLSAAGGAHHVGFTKDFGMAFVQNSLLNLPGLSDGSVTIVDLGSDKVVASMDDLKEAGFNPNSLVLLPQWNHLAGH